MHVIRASCSQVCVFTKKQKKKQKQGQPQCSGPSPFNFLDFLPSFKYQEERTGGNQLTISQTIWSVAQ